MIEEKSLDFIVILFHLHFQPLRYIKLIIKILSGKLMPHILSNLRTFCAKEEGRNV